MFSNIPNDCAFHNSVNLYLFNNTLGKNKTATLTICDPCKSSYGCRQGSRWLIESPRLHFLSGQNACLSPDEANALAYNCPLSSIGAAWLATLLNLVILSTCCHFALRWTTHNYFARTVEIGSDTSKPSLISLQHCRTFELR